MEDKMQFCDKIGRDGGKQMRYLNSGRRNYVKSHQIIKTARKKFNFVYQCYQSVEWMLSYLNSMKYVPTKPAYPLSPDVLASDYQKNLLKCSVKAA